MPQYLYSQEEIDKLKTTLREEIMKDLKVREQFTQTAAREFCKEIKSMLSAERAEDPFFHKQLQTTVIKLLKSAGIEGVPNEFIR